MNFEKELEKFSNKILQKESSNPEINEHDMPSSLNEGEIVLYTSDSGNVNVSVIYNDETFWLTQKSISELFNKSVSTISRHISNIFDDQELDKKSNLRFLQIPNSDKPVAIYSLDMIISVGYRVNSIQATKFRQWATQTLKEYIIKGFVLNDDMLKNGKPFGKDYFDELLERIKEIRASERRFYQKITDIYAECSYDYDSHSPITRDFFKNVQNKLLYAITGHTAPEIIHSRVDSSKEHMGLNTWKHAPDGKILKSDVTVSKNYLAKEELSSLNDIVTMYLDYAENQAKRNKLMSMQDWVNRLDAFLQFNEYDILHDFGTVKREIANELAIYEYKKFRKIQDQKYISDFDKETEKYLK